MALQKAGASSVGVRTKFYFQFITTPSSDTPGTSLLLHFDSKRYILGEITEGTQRACIQRNIGLKKVRALFLAGKTHWNNGGLIGMILTMAGVQESELDEDGVTRPRLDIHAGPMQLHTLACARRFVFRTGMPLSVHEVDIRTRSSNLQPILEDENVRVWSVITQEGSTEGGDGATSESQLQSEQHLRNEVVNNMFDSAWRRDRLFASKLRDLKLPAIVYVRDPETKTLVSHAVFDINNTHLDRDAEVLHRNPWPASTVEELPPAEWLPRSTVTSWVIKGHPQRGSFDPAKAKALGMDPGPKFSQLAAGKSVESDDGSGNTITPEMVLSPTRPGRGIALFDVPSLGHLSDLIRQIDDQWDSLFERIEAAVWLTRGHVCTSPLFQNLLHHQLKDMKHIISDTFLCGDSLSHDSSALSSGRLAQIAPSLFSVPRYDNSKAYNAVIDPTGPDVRMLFDDSRISAAKRGMIVHVEPTFIIDESEVAANLDAESFSTTIEPAVRDLVPEGTCLLDAKSSSFVPGKELDEPEIITLGTGSAAPSKYRNVSAVLLRMPLGMGNYLFDCGEGTLGQLKRVYNADQLDDILFNLRAIWISHLHADHHLGTVSVLKTVHKTAGRLSNADRPHRSPPYLISEINMLDYINEYQSVLGLPTDSLCTPICCDPYRGLSHDGKPFALGQNDPYIRDWRTVKVSHCHGAQAVSVTFKNGFKFSYSGDCRPSEAFCKIGADSDVLVHEATFDDGMEGDAMAKKHSTTGEAVGVALGMRAKNLILTHFSQRYQKIPVISNVKMPDLVSEEELLDDVDAEMINGVNDADAEGSGDPLPKLAPADSASWVEPDDTRELPIAVAFDLMRIKVSQIKHMKKIFPAISKMFELEDEKRDKARREVAGRQKAEVEQKLQARSVAMSKNRAKKDTKNKEKQMEKQMEKQSKKDKRKANGHEVDNAEQTRSIPAPEPIVGFEILAACVPAPATIYDPSGKCRTVVSGTKAAERNTADTSVAAKSAQSGDSQGVRDSTMHSIPLTANSTQQESQSNNMRGVRNSGGAKKRRKIE